MRRNMWRLCKVYKYDFVREIFYKGKNVSTNKCCCGMIHSRKRDSDENGDSRN